MESRLILRIFTTFAKQTMINRLSNVINRNRSTARISKVMSSSCWPTTIDFEIPPDARRPSEPHLECWVKFGDPIPQWTGSTTTSHLDCNRHNHMNVRVSASMMIPMPREEDIGWVMTLSLSLSLLFVGQAMSPHHSDQMSQRSQVSRVTLWGCYLNDFVTVFVFVFFFVFVFVITVW